MRASTLTGATMGQRGMASGKIRKKAGNGANLGFEDKLWQAADKMRGSMDAADYKHVVLGFTFLKYISDASEAKHAELEADEYSDPEDPEEYLAENIFWVPKDARWAHFLPEPTGSRRATPTSTFQH